VGKGDMSLAQVILHFYAVEKVVDITVILAQLLQL
jgi:hypothetical protein